MALAFRIESVTYKVVTVAEDGEHSTIDLSLNGNVLVHAVYIEESKPNDILAERRFTFPSSMSVEDMQADINEYGLSVRDARIATSELQQFVGAVVPLKDQGQEG